MSIIIYGDPHGEWRPLLAAVEEEVPDAVAILGDSDLARTPEARLVMHGHHHESGVGVTRDVIKVIGLTGAEVLRLLPGDVA